MIRHLFKIIWNRKGRNALLLLEIFVSFLILFGVCSLFGKSVKNYFSPLGFSYDNVWVLSIDWHEESPEKAKALIAEMKNRLKSYKEIEAVIGMANNNMPYSFSTSNNGGFYKKKFLSCYNLLVSSGFEKVFKPELVDGRWFKDSDRSEYGRPVIITEKVRAILFKDEPVVGKNFDYQGRVKIIGVIKDFKFDGEFSEAKPAVFELKDLQHPEDQLFSNLVIRVKSGTGMPFEEKIINDLSSTAKGWSLDIERMEEKRALSFKLHNIPLIVLASICAFLIFNVALGLFGVLWYNIYQRKAEIGLRRALGAISQKIYFQFLGEVLVLATLGMFLGIVLAAQFPLLKVFNVEPIIYIIAILVSIFFMYLLVTLCALYPGKLAARIQPAQALAEE